MNHQHNSQAKIGRFTFFSLSVAVILAVVFSPAPVKSAQDAAGDLDPTFAGFGLNGATSTGDLRVRSLALQTDGKIVVVGAGPIPNQTDWVPRLARYYATGSGENFDGFIAYLNFPGVAYDVTIQPDGKMVVAGQKDYVDGEGSERFFVARFNQDGTLDPGFGVGGVRVIDVSSDADGARALALQDDGKIVAAGYAVIGGDPDFAVVRLTANGSPDTTFSDDGMVTTGFGGCPGYDGAESVVIQPDGKILVGGYADEGSIIPCTGSLDFGIARYNPDGTLDTNFSDNGKQKIGFGTASDGIYELDIDTNNRIVAVGHKGTASGSEFAAAVLLNNGDLDTSWNGDGKWTQAIPGDFDSLKAATWMVDGKLLVSGSSDSITHLIRFDADGNLDPTYSDGGLVEVEGGKAVEGMLVQPDGRVVMALHPDTLLRFLPDGTPDTAGKSAADYYPGEERAFAVAVQPNGDIVLAGEAESPLVFFKRDVALVRYNWLGQIDPTFGQDGRAVYELPNDDAGRDIIVQPDGKIIVAGFREQSPDYDFVIWRFDPDGTLDTPFGSGGMAQIDFGGDDYGQAIVLQPDGKIVIAGFTDLAGSRWLSLARVDASGELDLSFSENGKYTYKITQDPGYVSLRNLARLPGGDLLAVGGHAGDFYALRLTADGAPVSSFDGDGYAEFPLSGNDEAWTVDHLSSGRIVIAGGSNGDFMLLFVNPDGSMCLAPCNFFGDSRIRIDFGWDEQVYDVDVQDNDRILLVGGGDTTDPALSNFMLARISYSTFPVEGYKLDTSFGENGQKRYSFAKRTVGRSAVLYYNQIIIAGFADNGHDDDFAVARLLNDSTTAPPGISEDHTVFFPFVSTSP